MQPARLLGIEVVPGLLAIADEVIEYSLAAQQASTVADRFGSRPAEISDARRARRSIFEKLGGASK
jgi:hypothetical protein